MTRHCNCSSPQSPADSASALREEIEALPLGDRAPFATRLAAVLLETAGYEAARTDGGARVTELMALARQVERLGAALSGTARPLCASERVFRGQNYGRRKS